MRMNNRYDEIINLPHHVSKTRPQMPMSDRAAQFAPFAALTGYDSAIKETGRLTDEKIELDEEALTALDMKYQILMDTFDDAPEVTITFFQPDERKAGGKYIWKPYVDMAEELRYTERHKRYYKMRKETMERVFADAKEKYGMRYTRYTGLAQVTNWVKLKFAAMNLKKLARWKWMEVRSPLPYLLFCTYNVQNHAYC